MKFDAFWLTTLFNVEGRSGRAGAAESVEVEVEEAFMGAGAVMAVEVIGVLVPEGAVVVHSSISTFLPKLGVVGEVFYRMIQHAPKVWAAKLSSYFCYLVISLWRLGCWLCL